MGLQKMFSVVQILVIFCVYLKPIAMVPRYEQQEYCGVLLSQYGNFMLITIIAAQSSYTSCLLQFLFGNRRLSISTYFIVHSYYRI